jgi:hypothetical protein
MRANVGLALVAIGIVTTSALLVRNYAGYAVAGTWNARIIVLEFDTDWDSHWMWFTPIVCCLVVGSWLYWFSPRKLRKQRAAIPSPSTERPTPQAEYADRDEAT